MIGVVVDTAVGVTVVVDRVDTVMVGVTDMFVVVVDRRSNEDAVAGMEIVSVTFVQFVFVGVMMFVPVDVGIAIAIGVVLLLVAIPRLAIVVAQ